MLGQYVVKLHVHCTMRDGDARPSGSKTSAHSVHRLLMFLWSNSTHVCWCY